MACCYALLSWLPLGYLIILVVSSEGVAMHSKPCLSIWWYQPAMVERSSIWVFLFKSRSWWSGKAFSCQKPWVTFIWDGLFCSSQWAFVCIISQGIHWTLHDCLSYSFRLTGVGIVFDIQQMRPQMDGLLVKGAHTHWTPIASMASLERYSNPCINHVHCDGSYWCLGPTHCLVLNKHSHKTHHWTDASALSLSWRSWPWHLHTIDV